MSVLGCLQQAQKLLGSGAWLPPTKYWQDFALAHPADSSQPGRPCERDDEGVAFFSVTGAIALSAKDDAECAAALRVLEVVCSPAAAADEEFWRGLPPEAATEAWWREHGAELRTGVHLARAAVAEATGGLKEWLAKVSLAEVLGLFDLAIACAPETE